MLGAEALAAEPLASDTSAASSSASGTMAPFEGFGTQGDFDFRGVRYWASEGQTRFRARESDGSEVLGITDKDGFEKVWYEIDLIDILHGASILSMVTGITGGVTVLSQELVSNGESTHMARVLIGAGSPVDSMVRFYFTCSDGSQRVRSLKIRSRLL